MIEVPLPGSTPPPVRARLPAHTRLLNVCSAPNWWPTSWATKSIVEASPTGFGIAVQAPPLKAEPTTPRPASPPPGSGHDQVGEVVARGAQIRAATALVRRSSRSRSPAVAARCSSVAAPHGCSSRSRPPPVEVELVVPRDQHQAHREVLLVDLVEPVDQRGLGRRRRARGRRRRNRAREQRQPVDAQRTGRRRPRRRAAQASARRRRPASRNGGGRRLAAVGDVLSAARVDVPGARPRPHRRVEASGVRPSRALADGRRRRARCRS